jgi:hypothetical protein
MGGGELNGVSCPSATACAAVGSYFIGSNSVATLAEWWNGSAWKLQATSNPDNGAAEFDLNGVSCTSATACVAVGDYDSSLGPRVTLAELWNGSSWNLQSTPNPGGQSSVLYAVSCASATACTAVGSYESTSGAETFAERWNGTSWKLQYPATPNQAQGSELLWVSCAATTDCTAVGDYRDSSGTQVPLAERWNGTSWKLQSTPNPAGSLETALNGVSCTSATDCTAVGEYETSAGMTLAELWDGSAWQLQTTPSTAAGRPPSAAGRACWG